MTHFLGKVSRAFLFASLATLMMTASAWAAEGDLAIGVGATTDSPLRLREGPSTSTEILTNLDKGVAVAILDDETDGWYKVNFDGMIGYLSADYVVIDQDNVFEAPGRVSVSSAYVRSGPSTDAEAVATLTQGTTVTVNGFEDGWYDVTCQYGTEGYIRSDLLDLTQSTASSSGSSVVDLAQQYLGVRYVYGGASPSGFDCSGYTMYIYQQFGYALPHSATSQWQSGLGTKVWSVGALQPGDLVFFNDPSLNAGKACSHTGIYVGNGQFIHASSSRSGGVIISDLTSGYYNRYFVGGLHL